MTFRRGIAVLAIILFLHSAARAEQRLEDGSLPPEKVQMIYDTLLPKEKGEGEGEKTENMGTAMNTDMTAEKITEILRSKGIELQGMPGQHQFIYERMQVFLLTDSQNNRMRLMTPLARMDLLRQAPDFSEIDLLQKMMGANYLATGNVRLCTNRQIIWAAFLHPLDSLVERDLINALEQLAETVRNARGYMN